MHTILIVDDAQTDRELVGKVVTAAGHRTIFASNGEQAIATAKEQRPSLIFLDVVMPVMDGFATCRALKKDAATAPIPVVLVTSKGTDSDKFWGRKQGADDHLVKPFTPADLESVLRRYLR